MFRYSTATASVSSIEHGDLEANVGVENNSSVKMVAILQFILGLMTPTTGVGARVACDNPVACNCYIQFAWNEPINFEILSSAPSVKAASLGVIRFTKIAKAFPSFSK